MANRFPLVLDTTNGNKIAEIPAGDNLDLRNVSIVDVQDIDAIGTINAAAITINGEQLQPGTFTDLNDTPSTYSGFEGFLVRVKADGTGLEYFELGSENDTLRVNALKVSGSALPTDDNTSLLGSSTKRWSAVYGTFFQGSIKGNDGSTVFDASSNQIPYAVIAGAPQSLSDLPNDQGYITAEELRAVIPAFIEDGLVTVEVINKGDLQGSVFGEDSTLLVDHINSRINTARLTRNGAAPGQTIVWDELLEEWIPGIAGDITGFSSNKSDTLTVETGYKITFQDSPGLIEGDTIQINTTGTLDIGSTRILNNNNFLPETNNTSRVGLSNRRFNEGNFNILRGTSIIGDLSGDVTSDIVKSDIGVFGDNTQGNLGYQLHVLGDLGFTGGNIWMNGGKIYQADLPDATGNFSGSFYGDDSTIIIDGTNNTITGNLQFPSATGVITGNVIFINATDRIDAGDIQMLGNIYPETTETGAIGTVARKFNEGNFVTLRAEEFNIDTVTANTIETENFVLSGTGTGTLQSATDLVLQAGNRIISQGGPFKFANLTQAEGDTIVTQSGDSFYNTTTNRLQFFQNGNWVELHKGIFEGDIIGSIFADDSEVLFDAGQGKLVSPTTTGDATFENNVTVQGNLTVQGTTTSIETTNTDITDNVITLNKGETGNGVSSGTSGIEVDRGTDTNVSLIWDDNIDKWTIGNEGFVANTVEAGTITGNIVGVVTGELVGSVFADDSTNIVDAVNAEITANKVTTPEVFSSANLVIYADGGLNVTSTDSGLIRTQNDLDILSQAGTLSITGTTSTEINTGVTDGSVTLGNAANAGQQITIHNATADGSFDGAFTGELVGELVGSVFVDDSTKVIDGLDGSVIANSLNITNVPTLQNAWFLSYNSSTGEVTKFAADAAAFIAPTLQSTGLPSNTLMSGTLNAQNNNIENVNLVNAFGDLTGSIFSDDSVQLVDGVAGKIVGPYDNGVVSINPTNVTTYDIFVQQDANINDLYVANRIYGGATGDGKNVRIASTAPANSTGADGDKEGMVAFDATSIYYCIADWASPGTADIWVKQDWGTTGSW